jgi:hypothetical protein
VFDEEVVHVRVRLLSSLLVLLVLVACGGDGEDRLTKEELIRRGDAICGRALSEITRLPQNDFRVYVTRGHDIFERQVDELRALEPPKDAEKLYDEFLDKFDEVVAKSEEASKIAAKGDEAAARKTYASASDAATEARRIARSYGFKACSGPTAG